jgi:hypothetical protein
VFGHRVQDVSAGSTPVLPGSTLPYADDEGCAAGAAAPEIDAIVDHSGS